MGTRDDEEKIIKELNPELFKNSETHDDEDEGGLSEDEWDEDEGKKFPNIMLNIWDEDTDPTVIYDKTKNKEWKQERKEKLRIEEELEQVQKQNFWFEWIMVIAIFVLFITFCTSPSRCNPDLHDCYIDSKF